MIASPSPTGANGRDGNGRFTPGNTHARGNPHARHIGQLRAALLQAVTPEDMEAIARKLIDAAKGGDLHAIRELLNRTLGKPTEADLIERLEALEQALNAKGEP